MSQPPRLQNWVRGLLGQLALSYGDLDVWIVREDKPTKIADMLWWYINTHPEENRRTGVPLEQRVRALVETVYWLRTSIAHSHKTLEHVGLLSFTMAIQSGKAGTWDVERDLAGLYRNACEAFVEEWEEKWRNWVGLYERSLLKPTIARRVALMHGTTKARWERDVRPF